MQKKDVLILSSVFLILGILLVRQFYVSREAERLKRGEENQLLALEISRLIKANTDLRLEIGELATTSEKYQQSLGDRKSASEELLKNLEKYKIIAGVAKAEGPGVEIKIEGDIDKEQMVDLINALKNIGIEGLSINDKRIIISSYFEISPDGLLLNGTKLLEPYNVIALGNAALIEEAIKRKGGILEQIESGSKDTLVSVIKKEKLVLEAVR